MNVTEQNRTIASFCGCEYNKPTQAEINSGSFYQYEPNYSGNLNLMQQAEKFLTNEQCHAYHKLLIEIDKPSCEVCEENGKWAERWTWHVSAKERAEAFVKIITGKDAI